MKNKEIKIKDIRPAEVMWECPQCGKENHDFVYTPDTKIFQCNYCGYILGSRNLIKNEKENKKMSDSRGAIQERHNKDLMNSELKTELIERYNNDPYFYRLVKGLESMIIPKLPDSGVSLFTLSDLRDAMKIVEYLVEEQEKEELEDE